MATLKIKDWVTGVLCESCGKMIQSYPVYIPNSRIAPDPKNPGFMLPPSFMRVCIPCIRKILDDVEKADQEGLLLPTHIWRGMQIEESIFVKEDGSECVARNQFPEEFKQGE